MAFEFDLHAAGRSAQQARPHERPVFELDLDAAVEPLADRHLARLAGRGELELHRQLLTHISKPIPMQPRAWCSDHAIGRVLRPDRPSRGTVESPAKGKRFEKGH